MRIFNFISKTLQSQFGVTRSKADESTQNIITNFANCAKASAATVQTTHADEIERAFNYCFANADIESQKDIDKFEKAIISCMCACAKNKHNTVS